MTELRQNLYSELEKIPEDKLVLVLQIVQSVNELYSDNASKKKQAYNRLEQLRRHGTVVDERAELAQYRDEKYGK